MPPQPTGERHSAGAGGDGVNYLAIAPADFNLETNQWHGFAWIYFDTLPSIAGHVMPIISQYDGIPDDSAFATGVVNTGGSNVFALGTCREVLGVHVFDNTLANNWLANHGDLQTTVWYFLDFWLDTDLSQVSIRVNAASDGQDITTIADLPPCMSLVDLTTFVYSGGPHPTQDPMNGRLGGVGFRRGSKWSDEEITYLYNGGCQILYGEVDTGAFPDIFTDLYGLWDMQEPSNTTRINSEGTAARDFIDGTVPQECGTCWDCGGG